MAVHKHQKVYSIKNAPLKIITHGWKSSVEDRSVVLIKDAYLETDNVNVISFDWSSIADTYYCVAAFLANFVAEIMALFLEALQLKYGVRGRDMHLIGHSLGAHVVGMAASQTSFAISRVTGLDPAAPLFEWPFLLPPSLRIDSSSADFVDIIHSCGELMGFAGPLGHEDFFPNSGMFPQPGCEDEDFYTSASCSHARAYEYFTDTIYDGTVYPSWNCESWEAFLNGKCTNVNYMGERAVQALTGNYFLFISYTSK
ncbi:pancreatic triacylglycerol lipase-like [Ostrinia nubilalis]|uniref:pancreatic triacylglycerol lipase-like n=1 Tax=Ostrinia nubilalis TaxID=29057 RepID=UPI0030822C82